MTPRILFVRGAAQLMLDHCKDLNWRERELFERLAKVTSARQSEVVYNSVPRDRSDYELVGLYLGYTGYRSYKASHTMGFVEQAGGPIDAIRALAGLLGVLDDGER